MVIPHEDDRAARVARHPVHLGNLDFEPFDDDGDDEDEEQGDVRMPEPGDIPD